jgi:hypothetical protein
MIMNLKKRPGPNRGCRAMKEEKEEEELLNYQAVPNVNADKTCIHRCKQIFQSVPNLTAVSMLHHPYRTGQDYCPRREILL